jgi:hypothetical protein
VIDLSFDLHCEDKSIIIDDDGHGHNFLAELDGAGLFVLPVDRRTIITLLLKHRYHLPRLSLRNTHLFKVLSVRLLILHDNCL